MHGQYHTEQQQQQQLQPPASTPAAAAAAAVAAAAAALPPGGAAGTADQAKLLVDESMGHCQEGMAQLQAAHDRLAAAKLAMTTTQQ
jgi:hypothetical protein